MQRNVASAAVAVLLMAAGIGSASANCEHYELAELKAMEPAKLKLNYCLNNIEIRKQRIRQNTAGKLSDLEVQRPAIGTRRELDRNDRKIAAAGDMSAQCSHEADRILTVLRQKKANAAAIMQECSSE